MAKKINGPRKRVYAPEPWYSGMTARQLTNALALPPQEFPHGSPSPRKGRSS